VLVVEDEAQVLRFASDMLATLGFDVVAATDGARALEALRCHRDRLALVLLDSTLPGMAGEAVLAEAERAGSPVPVVLSSGYDAADLAARFAGHRIAGFLQKPYRLAELRSTVRRALTGR